jgi:hypothetical protein
MVDFGIKERIKKQKAAGRSYRDIARDIINPNTGNPYHPTTISRWDKDIINNPINPGQVKEYMDEFDYEDAGISDMKWGENLTLDEEEVAPNNIIDRGEFMAGNYGEFDLPNVFTTRGHLVLKGRGTWKYIGGEFDGKEWDELVIIRTSNPYQLPEEAMPELEEKIAQRFTEVRQGNDKLGSYQIVLIALDISSESEGEDADGNYQIFDGGIEWNTEYNKTDSMLYGGGKSG